MQCSTINNNRIWEIDLIRGIAIILMILFHLIVDLKDFYAYNLDYLRGFWYIEGKISAILFILICGVSSTLGRSSTLHGCKLFIWAMILTTVTYFYNMNYYILFGILHFLGISLLSAKLMRKLPIAWLMIASCTFIIVGLLFSARFVTNPYLFPIGLITSTFISLDYYPLFPWYGMFIFGIALGKILYANIRKDLACARSSDANKNLSRSHLELESIILSNSNKKRLGLRQVPHTPPEILTHLQSIRFLNSITYLGQHSLGIYLIHQPVLLALLYILHLL